MHPPRGAGKEDVESDHTDVVLDSAQPMEPAARGAVLHADNAPVGMGDMSTSSLHLLFRAIRKHSTAALSGEGGGRARYSGPSWSRLDLGRAGGELPHGAGRRAPA
jgi:hypothetical protein